MKECSNCHKTYGDSMNFCISCGASLNSAQSNVDNENAKSTFTRPHRKTSWWKKVFILVVALVVILFIIGNHINNAATYLRVEPNQLVAAKGGGEITVSVDYDGYVWTVNHAPEWVNVDEDDDNNKIRLEARRNTTGNNREGTITIQSGKLLTQVAISQAGIATQMSLSQNSLHFRKSGGSKEVTVETDGFNWQAEYPDFLNVEKDGDILEITAPSNSGYYRSGTIIVTEDNLRYTINIVQDGSCDGCNGEGERACTWCNGSGYIRYGMYASQCMACGGDGKTTCAICNGSGERD